MSAELTIAIAQTNPTVGDIPGNLARIRAMRADAAAAGADLVVYSELVVVGYPPEDLVLKHAFQDEARRALEELARDTADGGPALIVGAPWVERGELYNAMLLLRGGRVVTARYKHDLPNYGVFDEKRVFAAGPVPGPMAFPLPGGADQIRLGGMVCEDMWTGDVAEGLEESGAEILIVPNGSPFEHDKQDVRLNLAVARVTETGLPLIYCNQVGGQDELVFDGASFVLNADRRLVAQAKAFEEDLLLTRWRRGEDGVWACVEGRIEAAVEGLDAIYQAMCLGLRDYVDKNRFPGVVLGLSGGIDSALSAAVAVDALGPERVHAVMMPSRYTSAASTEDARAVADALGIRLDTIPIEPAVAAFGAMLEPVFAGRPPDITEENLQARIRGVHPDGAVQQARLDGADHRQQVRDVGRLRHALRRHVRRLLGAEGRVQDDRVRACPLAQPATAGARARPRRHRDSRAHHREAAIRRAARESDRPGQPAALRRAGRDPPGPGRAGPLGARAGRKGPRSGRGPSRLQPAGSRRVQAPPGAARGQDHAQGVRPRPPLPDHQRVPQGRPVRPGAEERGRDPAAERCRGTRRVRGIRARGIDRRLLHESGRWKSASAIPTRHKRGFAAGFAAAKCSSRARQSFDHHEPAWSLLDVV